MSARLAAQLSSFRASCCHERFSTTTLSSCIWIDKYELRSVHEIKYFSFDAYETNITINQVNE